MSERLPLHFNADTTAAYLIYNPSVVSDLEEILRRVLYRGLDDAGRDGDVLDLEEGDPKWESFASGMYHAIVLMRLRGAMIRSLFEAEPADLGPAVRNPLVDLHKAHDPSSSEEPTYRVQIKRARRRLADKRHAESEPEDTSTDADRGKEIS